MRVHSETTVCAQWFPIGEVGIRRTSADLVIQIANADENFYTHADTSKQCVQYQRATKKRSVP